MLCVLGGQAVLGCGDSSHSAGVGGAGGGGNASGSSQTEGGSAGKKSNDGGTTANGGNPFTSGGSAQGGVSSGGAGGGTSGAAGKAGSGGGGAGGGSAGSGGTGGSGGNAVQEEYPNPLPASSRYIETGLNANIAALTIPATQPESSAESPLWLMSSSLERFQSLNARFAFWMGEVKNFAETQVCDATVKLAFKSQGTTMYELAAIAEGEERAIQGLRVRCIQPKAIAPAYFIQTLDQQQLMLGGKLDAVEVTWMTAGDAANEAPPNPLLPSTELEQIVGSEGAWQVKVELKGAAAGTIKNVRYSAYPRLGEFLGQPVQATKDTLAPGESWVLFTPEFEGAAGVTQRIRSSLWFDVEP
jgi:hypothetical protein